MLFVQNFEVAKFWVGEIWWLLETYVHYEPFFETELTRLRWIKGRERLFLLHVSVTEHKVIYKDLP